MTEWGGKSIGNLFKLLALTLIWNIRILDKGPGFKVF